MKQQTNRNFLILGFFLFCIGMTAAAFWDLPLDAALHHGTWLPAVLMECFGFYPMYLPPIFLFFCLAKTKTVPKWARFLFAVLAVCGGAALIVYAGNGLVKRAVPHFGAILCGFSLVFALCCALFIFALRDGVFLQKIKFVCAWGCVYLLLDGVFINVLKLIWNRTRFDDMLALGDFTAFTAWYRPFGAGGTSFPSGHVAAACSIFVLVLCCDVFAAFAERRLLVWSGCWAYIAWMALCRIIIGRHYLSDTLMAAFVMIILFFAMTQNRFYRSALARLHQNQTE
ncbi:MAG: phosphatase PAP2 family protein [Ruthenibacterium sp.]